MPQHLHVLFFFNQKTAYEMRIGDWISDVCSSDLAPAALGVPAAYIQGAGAPLDEAELAAWWTRLDDPALSGLIDRAIAHNLDIVQAQARLRQARESLRQARAAFLPQVNGSASGGRNYSSRAAGEIGGANG